MGSFLEQAQRLRREKASAESQRATARLTTEEMLSFFNTSLKLALILPNFGATYIHNMDETGFFRNFGTVGSAVWVRRGRKHVARKRGWARQHIATLVSCFSAGTTNIPCLRWHNKKVKGEWFLKKKGPVRIKGTPVGWSSEDVFQSRDQSINQSINQPLPTNVGRLLHTPFCLAATIRWGGSSPP